MVPVLAPDGTPIALVADWEGEIKAVNLKNGKTRFRLRGHTQRVDSIDTTVLPDGTPVAVACDFDQNTTVWDLRDGSELPYRLPLWGDVIGAVALPDQSLIMGLSEGDSVAVHPLT